MYEARYITAQRGQCHSISTGELPLDSVVVFKVRLCCRNDLRSDRVFLIPSPKLLFVQNRIQGVRQPLVLCMIPRILDIRKPMFDSRVNEDL